MIAVIFEVFPADGRKGDYLEQAARLKVELERMDGCCLCPSGATRKRSLAGALVLITVRRSRPAARASSEIIVCESLPLFVTMACPSAAIRHRRTVVPSMTYWSDVRSYCL
jgi:hypothetical protein